MKYIKPHLSPELRAQITPSNRRDVRLTAAGVFFLLVSAGLMVNLWPKSDKTSPVNNKTTLPIAQSGPDAAGPEKQVLGATTESLPVGVPADSQFTQYTIKTGDTLFNISQKYNVQWDSIAQI